MKEHSTLFRELDMKISADELKFVSDKLYEFQPAMGDRNDFNIFNVPAQNLTLSLKRYVADRQKNIEQLNLRIKDYNSILVEFLKDFRYHDKTMVSELDLSLDTHEKLFKYKIETGYMLYAVKRRLQSRIKDDEESINSNKAIIKRVKAFIKKVNNLNKGDSNE